MNRSSVLTLELTTIKVQKWYRRKLKCQEQKEIYSTIKGTKLYSCGLQKSIKCRKTRHHDSAKLTLKKLETGHFDHFGSSSVNVQIRVDIITVAFSFSFVSKLEISTFEYTSLVLFYDVLTQQMRKWRHLSSQKYSKKLKDLEKS